MNEIFVDLYADTGGRRWLDLSRKFEHRAITEPLMRHQDRLGGQHGNTQVPKLLGSLARFARTGDPGGALRGRLLLGPGGPAPQLRHRRPRQG